MITGRPGDGGVEAGIVTVWAVVVVAACFAMAGLVLDGGVVLRARSDAFGLAGGAARAGAQELSVPDVAGGDLVLDPAAATRAATVYLEARGATGTVRVDGTRVTVTVHDTARLQLLSVAGARTVNVDATATADALESGG